MEAISGGRRRRRRPIWAWRWDRILAVLALAIGGTCGVLAVVVMVATW